MKAKHDRDGGGRQHLLVVVVVQTVSSCQGKSVANLRGGYEYDIDLLILVCINLWCIYQHSTTFAVDVVSVNVLIT